ncbi:MAG: asparaginase [Gracilibacteraceae bacterium]|jgi:L-asparaginase|nr:asparaginase [Gracilibacteraceae bacterium]
MNNQTKVISLIATGGTIASLPTANGDYIAQLSGAQLVAGLENSAIAGIRATTLWNKNSYALDLSDLPVLAAEVQKNMADDTVRGIVITHGTDTLEETAFFLALVTPPHKPVILTGAQLTAGVQGGDGPLNITDAVTAAGKTELKALGPLICFAGFLYDARDAVKTDCAALQAFDAPGWGPAGRVDGDKVYIARLPRPRPGLGLAEPAAVLYLRLALGFTGEELLRCAAGYRGVVLEAFGRGDAHPTVAKAVAELVASNVPVVLTSRCAKGFVKAVYGNGGGRELVRAGVWPAGDLSGEKARLLLALVVAGGFNAERGRQLFLDWGSP